MEVLMSFAVSSVVWREPMADEAAGIAEGSSGEGLILEIYVPCKKRGGKKEKQNQALQF